MAEPVPHSYFSTAHVEPERRFEVWRESIRVLYDVKLDDGADPCRFNAMTSGYLFGAVTQIRCAANKQAFRRSPVHIAQDGLDHYMIQVFRQGRCFADTGKGELVMRPGDVCVFDNAQPLETVNEDFDLLALFIPRSLLANEILGPDDQNYRVVRREAPLARLLHAHMCELEAQGGDMTADQGMLVTQPTVAMVASALNGSPNEVSGGCEAVEHALTGAIKRHIENHANDPTLTPEVIMATFGINRSRLYRMFESYGGVAAYIRSRRLRRALDALIDPRNGHRRIIEIAFDFGFGSEISFTRAFRRQYGMSPSEARQAGRMAYARGEPLAADGAGDHEWEYWIRTI